MIETRTLQSRMWVERALVLLVAVTPCGEAGVDETAGADEPTPGITQRQRVSGNGASGSPISAQRIRSSPNVRARRTSCQPRRAERADRKSTRLNSSHERLSRMPSSA